MGNITAVLLAVLLLHAAPPARAEDDDASPPPAAGEEERPPEPDAGAAAPAPSAPSQFGQRHKSAQHSSAGSTGGGAAEPAGSSAPRSASSTPSSTGGESSEDNPAASLGASGNFVNGIMFVGFSPQDHPNGGAGTPKYDAYNYLIRNQVDPNDKTWAPAAAKGLNKKYPCKFWAQDGETLIYEDEYIHSAPPGHGAPGGAIPGAKGEFIWGGMDGYVPPGNPCGGPSGQVNPRAGGGSAPPHFSSGGGGSSSGAGGSSGGGSTPNDGTTRVAYREGDALSLHDAEILNNPPNLADWPVTAKITALEIRPHGVHVEFGKREGAGRWPDITPPGWDGPLQYTLGMALFINGRWYASAPIQFWHGLEESGGEPGAYARNWFYDASRWGPMSAHQPVKGEKIGFFVVAGNVRNLTDGGSQSPVKERTNVVIVPMPGSGGASYSFK